MVYFNLFFLKIATLLKETLPETVILLKNSPPSFPDVQQLVVMLSLGDTTSPRLVAIKLDSQGVETRYESFVCEEEEILELKKLFYDKILSFSRNEYSNELFANFL